MWLIFQVSISCIAFSSAIILTISSISAHDNQIDFSTTKSKSIQFIAFKNFLL
jgi:hypothetical protein